MARQSFFAEKRAGTNNPNFFSTMDVDEIRKSVKRIIRDVKYDNIVDQDYIYFTNEKVIAACLAECTAQYQEAQIILHALNSYIVNDLNKGFVPYRNIDIYHERVMAANQQMIQNVKFFMWYQFYQMFDNIRHGADPKAALNYIKMANFNMNYL